jgi:hypothetical protein
VILGQAGERPDRADLAVLLQAVVQRARGAIFTVEEPGDPRQLFRARPSRLQDLDVGAARLALRPDAHAQDARVRAVHAMLQLDFGLGGPEIPPRAAGQLVQDRFEAVHAV